MPESKNVVVMIPRLGNIQATVLVHGEGMARQPYVKFERLLPSPSETPQEYWRVEDVATLRELCANILTECFRAQSLQLQAADPEEKAEG